jgi:hypothetical protein
LLLILFLLLVTVFIRLNFFISALAAIQEFTPDANSSLLSLEIVIPLVRTEQIRMCPESAETGKAASAVGLM